MQLFCGIETYQFIKRGLVLANMAGSFHLTSRTSPVFISLTTFVDPDDNDVSEIDAVVAVDGAVSSTVWRAGGAAVVVGDDLSSPAENMNRADNDACRANIIGRGGAKDKMSPNISNTRSGTTNTETFRIMSTIEQKGASTLSVLWSENFVLKDGSRSSVVTESSSWVGR